jgi:hypothetical protein
VERLFASRVCDIKVDDQAACERDAQ